MSRIALFTLFILYVRPSGINCKRVNDESTIEKVHVIFMNHLDIGYNGIPKVGFINNIINIYFNEYFPRAVEISNELEKQQIDNISFIYTTHPWLVQAYLRCSQYPQMNLNNITLKCPSQTQVSEFNRTVAKGRINWHAGPMNMQPENMNQFLFEQSLVFAQDLDRSYGITRAYATLSQRDVPGMTQAVIPSLVKYGIKAVSVGVNPSTSPPDVPNAFIWQFEGSEVIGLWHKGGYPANPGPNPSQPGGLARDDCVIVDGFSEALCFAFRTDNSGPPTGLKEIKSNFAILRSEFPGADVVASTFDDYIQSLYTVKNKLPVITNEIGDTWIQGISSDPKKMAKYRSFSQTLQECFQRSQCKMDDVRIFNAIRYLIKPPEHTWGLPTAGDTINWSNKAFDKVKTESSFANCSQAWAEQRSFIDLALEALQDHPWAPRVVYGLSDLQPYHYDLRQYTVIADTSQVFTCEDGIQISFNQQGFVNKLTDPYNKMEWASNENPIGEFLYNTYNDTDFQAMDDQYAYSGNPGFYKQNLTENFDAKSQVWPVKLVTLYKNIIPQRKCDFLLKLTLNDKTATSLYGAPEEILIQYTTRGIDPDVGGYPGGADIVVQWFNKRTTRLPESLSYSIKPSLQSNLSWKMSKIGHLIDPGMVVSNGSQYIHAVDNGVYYINNEGNGLQLLTQDVPLVLLVTKERAASPFPVPLQPISGKDITGIAYNFYNNIWDTNYILWYPYLPNDQNFKARFKINFYNRKPTFQTV